MLNPSMKRPHIEFNNNPAGNIQHEIFGDGVDNTVQNLSDTWSYDTSYVDRHHFMMIPFNKSAIFLDCQKTESFTRYQESGAAIVPLRLHLTGELQTKIREKLDTIQIRDNIAKITNSYFNKKGLPLSEFFIQKIVITTMDLIYTQLCEEEGRRFILEAREGYRAALKNFECRLRDPQDYRLDEEYGVFKKQITERIQMNDHKITKDTQAIAEEQGTKDFMWSFTSPLVAIVLFCAGIGVAWWLKTKK